MLAEAVERRDAVVRRVKEDVVTELDKDELNPRDYRSNSPTHGPPEGQLRQWTRYHG